MSENIRKKGLGRGLSTLLAQSNSDSEKSAYENKEIKRFLPIEKIQPNFDQPRKIFNKTKLEELAMSISQNGIIQPVIVRRRNSGFELIAGERRWRAAQLSKLHEIPAIVVDITEKQVLEYSIIENVQREDLSPIEEANSYKKLIESHHYTQEQVSTVLGKSRSHIANMLRLLTLPKLLINFLEEQKLTVGHARALIGLDNAVFLARKIISENLSVRQTEDLIKKSKKGDIAAKKKGLNSSSKDVDTINLERSLKAQTNFTIKIEQSENSERGKLVIYYNSLEDLDSICNILFERKN
tara:strand:- start:326 stop:1216 length:891 start_codon:yes stop_codon:yes gene_type:complete